MREKIQPLYNRCKHEVEKRGRCKRENEDKFNKQLCAIQGTFNQAFMRTAKRFKIDWIKDGSPHSYGSYHYRELFEADNLVTWQTAKSTLGLRLKPISTNDHWTHANHKRGDTSWSQPYAILSTLGSFVFPITGNNIDTCTSRSTNFVPHLPILLIVLI